MASSTQQPAEADHARLHVQIPSALLNEVRAVARENQRTVAGEVRHALLKHLRAERTAA